MCEQEYGRDRDGRATKGVRDEWILIERQREQKRECVRERKKDKETVKEKKIHMDAV